MRNVNKAPTSRTTHAGIGLGLVTVAFAGGLIVPVPVAGNVKWGTTYLNPEQTMAVCVCDGGEHCAPCSDLEEQT